SLSSHTPEAVLRHPHPHDIPCAPATRRAVPLRKERTQDAPFGSVWKAIFWYILAAFPGNSVHGSLRMTKTANRKGERTVHATAGNCLFLSHAAYRAIRRHTVAACGLAPILVDADGRTVPGGGRDPLQAVAAVTRLRRHALAESVRWGEPYLFLLADG